MQSIDLSSMSLHLPPSTPVRAGMRRFAARTYPCDVCGSVFARASALATHKEHAHGVKPPAPNPPSTRPAAS
ncbi:hypothetical protein BCR35DRAFT_300468 [Leucosporidium creatinivorum]|uniref:C2H2-type domain-containing protein n=1 Tax=Leucosporidium creatinivorum TaxID=106004 RepID=A0A1Y2G2Z7_9BASI|nr:hypothetical protein BCR35DRAFT_300468 [Leucosporidium creatinivorum]